MGSSFKATSCAATFAGSRSSGWRKRSSALPVAKVTGLAVALEWRWAATFAPLATGVRCCVEGTVTACAEAASSRAAALAREIGKGSLSGPV
jgi:hypothetical protein